MWGPVALLPGSSIPSLVRVDVNLQIRGSIHRSGPTNDSLVLSAVIRSWLDLVIAPEQTGLKYSLCGQGGSFQPGSSQNRSRSELLRLPG